MTGSAQGTTTHGAVVTRLKGDTGVMPPYVHLGGRLFNSPGVGGGVFGSACEPIEMPNPVAGQVRLPQFELTADVSANRFQQRRELLGVDRPGAVPANASPAVETAWTPSSSGP